MKYLTITTVENGWMVRTNPQQDPLQYNTIECGKSVHVFRDIKELQEKLPELLGVKESEVMKTLGSIVNEINTASKQVQCRSCNGTGAIASLVGSCGSAVCGDCLGTGRVSPLK